MHQFVAVVYLGLGAGVLLWVMTLRRPWLFGRFFRPLMGVLAMGPAHALPLLLLAGWLVTAAAAGLGALASPVGQLGLALHAVAWVELLLYALALGRSLPRLDGEPVRDEAPVLGWSRPLRPRWSPYLTWQIEGQVRLTPGILYREVEGRRLDMDVYQPPAGSPARPPILYVHGGAWITGSPRLGRTAARSLAREGWTVFAIRYRLAPRYPLPAAVYDVKAAIAWLRAHATEWGARDAPPLLMGSSAGGHLAVLAALTENRPDLQPGFEDADTRVAGAAICYGVTDLEVAYEPKPHPWLVWLLENLVLKRRRAEAPTAFSSINPIKQRAERHPPLLLVHGERDDLVSPELSVRFVRALRESSADHVHLLEVPNAVHGFDAVPSPLQQRSLRVILGFFAELGEVAT